MSEASSVKDAQAPLDAATIRSLVAEIVRLMDTKCIRMGGPGVDWDALFAADLEQLLACHEPADFELRVNRLLAQGGLSHAAFFHESAQRAPARYAINATFHQMDTAGGTRWAFQDVHEGGPAYIAGLRPGDILEAVDGLPALPPTLPTFALGTDSTLTIQDSDGATRQVRVVLPKAETKGNAKARPPMAEPTSVTARTIEPGLGYVKVAFFPGANGQRFAADLDRALETLSNPERLIIDLRGNLGGFVGSLRLMSYLTPDKIPVGYSLTRSGEDRKLRPDQLACIDKLPKTTADMLMMAFTFKVLHRDRSIRLVTEGLGPKSFHGQIVMLINEHTLSAGEMVAAFAAENGLATLIGTRTGGQVLGGANFTLDNGFVLRLPAAGWYSWSGAVVEGKGASPNVAIPSTFSALREGRDAQLEAAIAFENRPQTASERAEG